jgi:lipid A 3-O-deacylase
MARPGLSQAEGVWPEAVGARAGASANPASREFYQAEGYADWKLPWDWDLGKQWHLRPQAALTGGWLSDVGRDASIWTLGPTLELSRKHLPFTLNGGVSPTFLSRHQFIQANLGTDFQFTSRVGAEWKFASHWSLGYRFEHISNADISPNNPGLNMHLLGLTYHF